jgi:hypothetical protein
MKVNFLTLLSVITTDSRATILLRKKEQKLEIKKIYFSSLKLLSKNFPL